MLALALCSVPLASSAETTTIVALGDSLTQGYGLVPEDGFVAQLTDWVAERRSDVEFRNAGVSGDTTAGGLARVEWTLDDTVDGLIVALGANDVLRGLDPALSKGNLEGILAVAKGRNLPVLLVGVEAPSNYGQDYKTRFDGMYPELADTFQTLLYPGFLAALTDLPDRTSTLSKYFQPDGLHPNREGVALIVEGMGPSVLTLIDQAR